MDVTPTNMTDDQELAKVLESMNQQTAGAPDAGTDQPVNDVAATDTGTMPASEPPAFEPGLVTGVESGALEAPGVETPAMVPPLPPLPDEVASPAPFAPGVPAEASSDLESIKKTALEELRPLVDKLDLPADEKFDTLLLLIRSTDDKSLLTAAHEAARSIEDETKRAQALLDVIKEIDYFSGNGAQPTA